MTSLSPLTRQWTLLTTGMTPLRQVTVPLCLSLTSPVIPCVLTTVLIRLPTKVAWLVTLLTSLRPPVDSPVVPLVENRLPTPQMPLTKLDRHRAVMGTTRPTVKLLSMWVLTRTPPAHTLYPILPWVLSLPPATILTDLNTWTSLGPRQPLKTMGISAL